jgi:hypothetical protein
MLEVGDVMEREITVVVRVNGESHAEQIHDDILEAIRMRTTVFYVSEPYSPKKNIQDYAPEM